MRTYKNNIAFLSTADFLKLSDEDIRAIKRTRIVPPTIGSSNFGKIIVEYNYGANNVKRSFSKSKFSFAT